MSNRLAALLATAAMLSAVPAAHSDTQLPPAVVRAMARANVPANHVSIHVRDAGSNETIAELNSETLRSPASTIKVLTTFAALDMLGPAYTWKTHAYLAGKLANGVLNGDLVLVGGGDPFMTSDRWWSFVQNLRELGLAKITGDIVIDNTHFAPIAETRGGFDDQPYRTYNVLPDALMVNFQTSRFTITASPQRQRPLIVVNPLPANLVIVNQLDVGAGKCQGYNRGVSFATPQNEPNTVIVSGVLPAACGTYSINRAIMTPADYAYGTFRTLWTQSGGAIDGGMRVAPLPADATRFYTHDSITLAEVIRLVNKYSNNVMARTLLLTLGAEKLGVPTTAESGRTAILAWLADRNIRIPGFVLENGSGLSRDERITVKGLGDVLDAAWHSPFMPEFAASLPLSATDGTLRNRFRATGMQGRLRMKTGHLDDVNALAGFINAASGKTYVVVIIINHPGAQSGSGENIQAELIRWVFGQ